MEQAQGSNPLFEKASVRTILLKIAPPVMVAQVIQALYNIVDSCFVGAYSGDGLIALSVIFPIQFIITSLAVGTGVGVNIVMARYYAQGHDRAADAVAGTGTLLAAVTWAIFALLVWLFLPNYVYASASAPKAVEYSITYGNIVCIGSLGIYLESIWTKVHQAGGDMRIPMAAQVAGALTNIVLDPLLIFGVGPFPEMGITGAAVATVIGQCVAAVIVGKSGFRTPPRLSAVPQYAGRIYLMAYPSILMQLLCTLYIVVLNIILAGFSDAAVTVLGLYYKMQAFFFIPVFGLNTCIMPVLSYNYARRNYARCKTILTRSLAMATAFMLVGVACFDGIPGVLIRLFSQDEEVLSIGIYAFRVIGLSFCSAVFSLMMPIFFQSIGATLPSVLLALTRPVFCLMPIFWLLSLIGLQWTWWAFPLSETITGAVSVLLYIRQIRRWDAET